jgi:hypothetical protein
MKTLLCKKNYCREIQRSENRMRSDKSSEEDYGSKRAVLPMVIDDKSFFHTPSCRSA